MVCFAWLAHAWRASLRRKAAEFDCELIFFDCVETETELNALIEKDGKRILEDACKTRVSRKDCEEGAAAVKVLELALQEFELRVSDFSSTGPECEWATLGCAARMLRANMGDVQQAVNVFVQALEVRRRDRELYQLTYAPRADVRIIARNLQGRPVVFASARSVNGSLRHLKDQFVLAFEAACHLATENGYVDFIVDMSGLKVSQFMDIGCMKEFAAVMSTVYTERICKITIVDFACTAQVAWRLAKPLMDSATTEKFAFVSRRECQDCLRSQFHAGDFDKICRSFDINRDVTSTPKDRELFACGTALDIGTPVD